MTWVRGLIEIEGEGLKCTSVKNTATRLIDQWNSRASPNQSFNHSLHLRGQRILISVFHKSNSSVSYTELKHTAVERVPPIDQVQLRFSRRPRLATRLEK